MLFSKQLISLSYAKEVFVPADVAKIVCWLGSFGLTVLSGKRRETLSKGRTISDMGCSSWSLTSSIRPPNLRSPRVLSKAPQTSKVEPFLKFNKT